MQAQILTLVHHINLVSLIGYCDEAENKALIYEFMGNGNLRDFLSGKCDIALQETGFCKMIASWLFVDYITWFFPYALI